MNTSDFHIPSLLQKYIDNRCSEEEIHILLDWLKKTDDPDEFNRVSASLWNNLNERLEYPNEQHARELDREVSMLLNRIKQKEEKDPVVRISFKKTVLYRIAAIALLAISISLGFYFFPDHEVLPVSVIEKTTSQGETWEYMLADGSRVVLNSESRLKIPENFNKDQRVLELEGEGYFDVTSNPEKPFIIISGGTEVKVLGTSFNLKAYPEDDLIGVTVSTGKVLVNMSDMDLRLRINPNEHLTVNKTNGDVNKETIDENNYIKWMDGFLYFNKEPIREVIKTINRKYTRKVIMDCPDCDYVIKGTHDNKSIEAVVEAICFTTKLRSRNEGNNIILYK